MNSKEKVLDFVDENGNILNEEAQKEMKSLEDQLILKRINYFKLK